MTAGPERAERPRRSGLAWCAFLVGVIPTGCGQLVAPILALMAWLEIRQSNRPMRGGWLALSGVAVAAAWCGAFVWIAQLTLEEEQQAQVEQQVAVDLHAEGCTTALQRVAEGWAEAQVLDPWALKSLREDQVLPYLVEQGLVLPEDLCCPAAAATGETAPTLRFVAPLPADVCPTDRCIVLYEDRARHRRERGNGRHVLYADGHVDWLLSTEFRDALAGQQKAAADAARK